MDGYELLATKVINGSLREYNYALKLLNSGKGNHDLNIIDMKQTLSFVVSDRYMLFAGLLNQFNSRKAKELAYYLVEKVQNEEDREKLIEFLNKKIYLTKK